MFQKLLYKTYNHECLFINVLNERNLLPQWNIFYFWYYCNRRLAETKLSLNVFKRDWFTCKINTCNSKQVCPWLTNEIFLKSKQRDKKHGKTPTDLSEVLKTYGWSQLICWYCRILYNGPSTAILHGMCNKIGPVFFGLKKRNSFQLSNMYAFFLNCTQYLPKLHNEQHDYWFPKLVWKKKPP